MTQGQNPSGASVQPLAVSDFRIHRKRDRITGVSFACPACGEPLRAGRHDLGLLHHCVACNVPLLVPELRDEVRDEMAAEAAAQQRAREKRAQAATPRRSTPMPRPRVHIPYYAIQSAANLMILLAILVFIAGTVAAFKLGNVQGAAIVIACGLHAFFLIVIAQFMHAFRDLVITTKEIADHLKRDA